MHLFSSTISPSILPKIKQTIAYYIEQQQEYGFILDSNGYQYTHSLTEAADFCPSDYHEYEYTAGFGWYKGISIQDIADYSSQKLEAIDYRNYLYFIFVNYEYKAITFPTCTTTLATPLQFPLLAIFTPIVLIRIQGNTIDFSSPSSDTAALKELYDLLLHYTIPIVKTTQTIQLAAGVSWEVYNEKFQYIQQHIQQGNVYELNYCIPFTATNVCLSVASAYVSLNSLTEAPMAGFVKLDSHYILSGSPERYICQKDTCVISQPIKGTARRCENDAQTVQQLYHNNKERTENIMITDMVRNDLSILATTNSVEVKELCGVYSFKTVHQLISTVQASIDTDTHNWIDLLFTTFPMASMTGTPKQSALQIIDSIELVSREAYSGTMGYIHQNKLDLNVLIRSIFYNQEKHYLSYSVGSAITAYTTAEEEYQECLLKAEAMQKSLV